MMNPLIIIAIPSIVFLLCGIVGVIIMGLRQDRAIDNLNDVLKQNGIMPDPNLKLNWLVFKAFRLAKQYDPVLYDKMKKNMTMAFLFMFLFFLGPIMFVICGMLLEAAS